MAIIDRSPASEPEFFSHQVRAAKRYFRPAGSEGDRALADPYRVISGGMEACIPGYEVNRAEFPYWGIEMVAAGKGTVELDKRIFELMPGAVYAYGPGIPHRIAADRGEDLEKYFIDFTAVEPVSRTMEILKNRLAGRVLYGHAPETLRRTFRELSEYGARQGPRVDEILSSLVDLLLLKIVETTAEENLAESTAYAAYRRCRDVIDDEFLSISSSTEIAAAAHVDVSYLCRLFKRFDGDTPYRRLIRLRMNHAAGLLVREGMSVQNVARELGYDEPFTFSRRFKGTMGLSPRRFVERYGRPPDIPR